MKSLAELFDEENQANGQETPFPTAALGGAAQASPDSTMPVGKDGKHKFGISRRFVTLSSDTAAIAAMAPKLPDAEIPDSMRILPWGEMPGSSGVNVDDDTVTILPEAQQRMQLQRIPIYPMQYGKNATHTTTPENQMKPIGSAVPIVRNGQGLFIEQIQLSEEGKAEILNNSSFVPGIWLNDSLCVVGIKYIRLDTAGQENRFDNLGALPPILNLSASAIRAQQGYNTLSAIFERENAAQIKTLSAADASLKQPWANYRKINPHAPERPDLTTIFNLENQRQR